jgi:hypothetical protein
LGSYDESLPSLFDLRLWMMAQMKSVDELKALFARIPPFAVTPRHRLFYVSGLLIARKDTEACDYVSKEMLEDVTSIWPLVRIYCTAISGDLAQAKLLVQLFTEQSNQPVPQSLRDFILALSLKKGLPEAEKAWISYVQKEALLLSIAKSDLPAIVNSSGVIPTALSVRWKKDLSDLASRDIVAYVQDLAFYRAALWLHKDAMPPREQYDLLFYVFDHDITLSLAMIEPLMDSFRKSPAEAMLVCLNGFDRSLTPAAARYCSAKAKDLGFILQSRVMTAAYVLHETRPTDK